MSSWLNRGKGFKPRSEYAPIRRAGRRTRTWEKVRRQLKCQFAGMGVTTCELRLPGCMFDNGLGFAHRLKRRHIHTTEELRNVILICNNRHDVIELQGEAKMARIFDSVIAGREI
jgi:hypothetical protein